MICFFTLAERTVPTVYMEKFRVRTVLEPRYSMCVRELSCRVCIHTFDIDALLHIHILYLGSVRAFTRAHSSNRIHGQISKISRKKVRPWIWKLYVVSLGEIRFEQHFSKFPIKVYGWNCALEKSWKKNFAREFGSFMWLNLPNSRAKFFSTFFERTVPTVHFYRKFPKKLFEPDLA